MRTPSRIIKIKFMTRHGTKFLCSASVYPQISVLKHHNILAKIGTSVRTLSAALNPNRAINCFFYSFVVLSVRFNDILQVLRLYKQYTNKKELTVVTLITTLHK